LSFNIKGFFNNINHGCLIDIMHTKKIPTRVIWWVKLFLSDRSISICLNSITSTAQSVANSILQGSP
ncbi:hypothetical protein CONPUDRAFT_18228, partial [Coniophora puteana RWD-64-598 SS2]